LEDRGVLSLASQNWSIAENLHHHCPYFDPMDVATFLSSPIIQFVNYVQDGDGKADISIGGLLLEILRLGGTTAEAVQSMLMSVVESRYADYFFSGGIDIENREDKKERLDRALDEVDEGYDADVDKTHTENTFMTQRADFVAVQIPGGRGRPARVPAGATQSYVLVMSTLLVHSIIICSIVVWFMKCTSRCRSQVQMLTWLQQQRSLFSGNRGPASLKSSYQVPQTTLRNHPVSRIPKWKY
jgi:hypothetical protein